MARSKDSSSKSAKQKAREEIESSEEIDSRSDESDTESDTESEKSGESSSDDDERETHKSHTHKLSIRQAQSKRTKDPNREKGKLLCPTSEPRDRPSKDPYPEYVKANFDSAATWKSTSITLAQIKTQAMEAFEEMRFWRRNLWKSPAGKVGKMIIQEQARLLECWTKKTNSELIALTLHMIFLPLILQKSGRKVKAKSVKEIIEKRIEKWNNGCIRELVDEAEYLQQHSQSHQIQTENTAKIFASVPTTQRLKMPRSA